MSGTTLCRLLIRLTPPIASLVRPLYFCDHYSICNHLEIGGEAFVLRRLERCSSDVDGLPKVEEAVQQITLRNITAEVNLEVDLEEVIP